MFYADPKFYRSCRMAHNAHTRTNKTAKCITWHDKTMMSVSAKKN